MRYIKYSIISHILIVVTTVVTTVTTVHAVTILSFKISVLQCQLLLVNESQSHLLLSCIFCIQCMLVSYSLQEEKRMVDKEYARMPKQGVRISCFNLKLQNRN